MKRILKIWLPMLVVAFFLSACSKNFSTEKTAQAKTMIESIVAAGAADFDPKKLAAIQNLYNDAMKEIQYQDTLTFKNYTMAEYNLNQAMDDCDSLRAKMAEAKGEPPVILVARNKAITY